MGEGELFPVGLRTKPLRLDMCPAGHTVQLVARGCPSAAEPPAANPNLLTEELAARTASAVSFPFLPEDFPQNFCPH